MTGAVRSLKMMRSRSTEATAMTHKATFRPPSQSPIFSHSLIELDRRARRPIRRPDGLQRKEYAASSTPGARLMCCSGCYDPVFLGANHVGRALIPGWGLHETFIFSTPQSSAGQIERRRT